MDTSSPGIQPVSRNLRSLHTLPSGLPPVSQHLMLRVRRRLRGPLATLHNTTTWFIDLATTLGLTVNPSKGFFLLRTKFIHLGIGVDLVSNTFWIPPHKIFERSSTALSRRHHTLAQSCPTPTDTQSRGIRYQLVSRLPIHDVLLLKRLRRP